MKTLEPDFFFPRSNDAFRYRESTGFRSFPAPRPIRRPALIASQMVKTSPPVLEVWGAGLSAIAGLTGLVLAWAGLG